MLSGRLRRLVFASVGIRCWAFWCAMISHRLVRRYYASSSAVKFSDADLMVVFYPEISTPAETAYLCTEPEPVCDYGLGSIGPHGTSAKEVRSAGKGTHQRERG
jgi:hypothetical protein